MSLAAYRVGIQRFILQQQLQAGAVSSINQLQSYESRAHIWNVPFRDISNRRQTKFRRTKRHGCWPEPSVAQVWPPEPLEADDDVKSRAMTSSSSRLPPPTTADDPYVKQRRKCLLCANPHINVDYKNPRMLSQFISSFTGRAYDHHITGLCRMQKMRVLNAIIQSRRAGYMPVVQKNARYLDDPQLFDPMRSVKPNAY